MAADSNVMRSMLYELLYASMPLGQPFTDYC